MGPRRCARRSRRYSEPNSRCSGAAITKLRNVLSELPKEQHGQTRNLMRAAWKVKTAEEGEKRMEQMARLLEQES